MIWTHAVACFFSGAFLANAVPHFVQGICGNRFPTPFAKPPGKGLSSATVNVLWALVNIVIGWLLLRSGHLPLSDKSPLIFFSGVAILSVLSSIGFASRHAS
jgi:hypothetical protein